MLSPMSPQQRIVVPIVTWAATSIAKDTSRSETISPELEVDTISNLLIFQGIRCRGIGCRGGGA